MRRLPVGIVIENPVSGQAYRIDRFLGQGGFGTAYEVRRLSSRGHPQGAPVCLKFSARSDIWHGEAYFAGLLKDTGHVVKMHDAFPTTVRQGKVSRMVFAIEMEYIASGTVREACADGRLPWPEMALDRSCLLSFYSSHSFRRPNVTTYVST